ncbi:MAG: radical SAM protein [Bacteroidales bacterium]
MDGLIALKTCRICPRNCGVNRYSDKLGYCGSDADYNISSIVLHKGEEPIISGKNGICNVFFSRCNLQCIYCQNEQISCNKGKVISHKYSLEDITDKIISIFNHYQINLVGFVSPSHYIPHIIAIIDNLRSKGLNPITVYNTNSYDKAETIRQLEGYISVYLPDFKYMDNMLAKELSGANDYPEIAAKAIKEMYRQKGSTIVKNDEGLAESGLIIRHLVLPSQVENSLKVLRFIADELSSDISLSLMAQYHPMPKVKSHSYLNRKLYTSEYDMIVKESEKLGFHRGWIQELESSDVYLPDFNEEQPFN